MRQDGRANNEASSEEIFDFLEIEISRGRGLESDIRLTNGGPFIGLQRTGFFLVLMAHSRNLRKSHPSDIISYSIFETEYILLFYIESYIYVPLNQLVGKVILYNV